MTRGAAPLVALIAMLAGGRAAANTPAAPADIDGLVRMGKLGEAVSTCEAIATAVLSQPMKTACAKAALALGDRFAELGQPSLALPRWIQALTWDPALADDPAVLARVTGEAAPTPPATTAPAPEVTPSEPREPETSSNPLGADTPAPERGPDPDAVPEEPTPSVAPAKPMPPPEPGARENGHLSVGLGTGYADGLLGLTLGWNTDGRFSIEVAFGLLYPTFDVRARWYVLDDALTPTIGAGLLVPLSPIDRGGAGIGPMEAIYELAEAFHVDIGLAWMVFPRLDLGVAVSFVTPFDQVHPDTVVFFPQITGHAAWHF